MQMAVLAYVLWGVLPLFWRLLQEFPPAVVVAHRVVFSFGFLFLLLAVTRRLGPLKNAVASSKSPLKTVALSALAGVLIASNWCIFIYAVQSGHVVSASLGYFINPLMNVVFGLLFLREKQSRAAKGAVVLAFFGVLYLTLKSGGFPYIGVGLALLFGVYGLIKKFIRIGGAESLLVETGAVLVFALGYLVYAGQNGVALFGADVTTAILVVLTGVATATPLMLFGQAARTVPLGTLGMLQYIAPTLQLLVGVFAFGEPFAQDRIIGFILVWLALVVYVADVIWRNQRGGPQASGAR